MATTDETIYENADKGAKAQVKNSDQASKKMDKDFLKRAAMLGGAILAGGSIGGGLAYSMKPDEQVQETEEDVIKVIDEDNAKTFEEAFIDARAQVGPGGVFRWHGKVYNTYTEEEWNNMTDEEKMAFSERIQPVLTDADRNPENYQAHHQSHYTVTEHVTKVVHTDEYKIGEENVIDYNGQKVVAASAIHNGKNVILVDIDRDGVYDASIEDYNGNGQIDNNEISDISDKGVTVHDKSLIVGIPVSDSFQVYQEQIVEIEGQNVIAAQASYNGKSAILVDVDRDGMYDAAIIDSNNNKSIDDNEIIDISDRHIAVTDKSLVDPDAVGNIHNASDDIPVVEIEEEGRITIDDEEVIAAKGTVDGKQAVIIDVNKDGSYDVALVDANNNGELDDGDEKVNVVSSGARVQDRSLVDADEFDMADNSDYGDEDMPDYVNTLGASNDGSSDEMVVTLEEENTLAATDTSSDNYVVEVDSPVAEAESVVEVEVETELAEAETPETPEVQVDDTQYDEAASYYNDMAFNSDTTQDTGAEMMDDYGTV